MKRGKIIALVASIALILALVLSGCNGGGGGGSSEDKEYQALNPAGIFVPVETSALSPRIDNLDGKTIYVIQGEADPVIMPALAAALPVEFPNATFVYYQPASSFGPSATDATVQAEADGVVRGIGW